MKKALSFSSKLLLTAIILIILPLPTYFFITNYNPPVFLNNHGSESENHALEGIVTALLEIALSAYLVFMVEITLTCFAIAGIHYLFSKDDETSENKKEKE